MIDLHTHTIYSDGADSVETVFQGAQTLGLSYLSITDHNSVGAYRDPAMSNCKKFYCGTLLRGIEITCMYAGEIVEVLGYGFDLDKMERLLPSIVLSGTEKQFRECALITEAFLKAGIPFQKENICFDPAHESARKAFWKELKRDLENKRFLVNPTSWDTSSAFTRQEIYNPESPLYVDESPLYPNLGAAVRVIHESGGVAFLAHLYIYTHAAEFRSRLHNIVQEFDLDGVECSHSSFTAEQIADLDGFCASYGLLKSGGSDYHGARKPNVRLGVGCGQLAIPETYLANWPERIVPSGR